MRKKNSFNLLIFLIFIASNHCVGQSKLFKDLAKIPVNSPDVTALNKMIEVPVDHYNGTADISIPLYEIKYGDITVPLILRYNTTGIKVNEDASWVGLGWSLSVGGNISKQTRYGSDNNSIGSGNTIGYSFAPKLPTLEYGFDQAHFEIHRGTIHLTEDGTTQDYQSAPKSLEGLDGEPDLYMYSFLNRSGKFIFARHYGYPSTSETFDRSRIKFINENDTIKAVTPEGFRCAFGQKEYSYNQYVKEELGVLSLAGISDTYDVSDYKISSIRSPLGKEMNFFYTNQVVAGPTKMVNFSFHKSFQTYNIVNPPSPADNEISFPCVNSIYIDSICTNICKVIFYKSSRLDLANASKLDSIVIYDKLSKKRFKSIQFLYDYFQGDVNYGDEFGKHNGYNAPDYTVDIRSKRLKLLAVEENQGSYIPGHSFSYSTQALPYKTSFGVDFYGYFNGVNSNNTLLPTGSELSQYFTVPNQFALFQGAHRVPDSSNYIQAGMLKEIVQPTGVKTKLIYESNRFIRSSYAQDLVSIVARDLNVTQYDIPSVDFSIYQDQPISLNYLMMVKQGEFSTGIENCGSASVACMLPYVMIQKFNTVTSVWEQYQLVSFPNGISPDGSNRYIYSGTQQYSLTSGNYRLIAHYPDGYVATPGETQVSASFNYLEQPHNVNIEVPGGGLRIKRIENEDPVTGQVTTRSYSYSKGRNFNTPLFTRTFESYGRYDYPDFCQDFGDGYHMIDYITGAELYSTMSVNYSNSANGSPIGYEKVTETVSGGENGMTEYNYNLNSAGYNSGNSTAAPGLPTDNDLESGVLLSKIIYKAFNNSYKKVQSTTNTYQLYDKTLTWAFRPEYKPATVSGPGGLKYTDCYNSIGNTLYFYPIRMAKMNVASSLDSTFFDSGNIVKLNQYSYDSKGILKGEQNTTSDGASIFTEYNYPLDYTAVTSGWLQTMKNLNMIDIPVNIIKKRNNLVIGGSFMEYKSHDNIVTLNKLYNIETTVPKSIVSTVPNGFLPTDYIVKGILEYDNYGNYDYSQASNNTVTSYIWGYNNSLLIGSISNAQKKDVYINNFEDTGNSSDGDSKTGRKSSLNGCNLNISNLTNGSYILNYWLKGTGGWTFVNTVRSISSNSINEYIAGQVDDVRFYPAGASINTYTYDALTGVTSVTDSKNQISYYNYDDHNRLASVCDMNKNILKSYSYNYYVQNSGPPATGCITPVINSVTNGSGLNITVNCTPSTNATSCFLLITDLSTGQTVSGDNINCGTASIATSVPIKGKTYRFLLKAFGACNPSGTDSNSFDVYLP